MVPEELSRRYVRMTRKTVRFWKRHYAKWRRRTERRLLEESPKRNQYKGWTD